MIINIAVGTHHDRIDRVGNKVGEGIGVVVYINDVGGVTVKNDLPLGSGTVFGPAKGNFCGFIGVVRHIKACGDWAGNLGGEGDSDHITFFAAADSCNTVCVVGSRGKISQIDGSVSNILHKGVSSSTYLIYIVATCFAFPIQGSFAGKNIAGCQIVDGEAVVCGHRSENYTVNTYTIAVVVGHFEGNLMDGARDKNSLYSPCCSSVGELGHLLPSAVGSRTEVHAEFINIASP